MSHLDAYALDRHARTDSMIHRLDPRAKVLASFIYIIAVVSFDKYAVAELLPFFAILVFAAVLGFVPFGFIIKRLLIALPFVVLVGAFNPLIDRAPLMHIGALSISGGWVSFFSIMLRALLCIFAATVLVATTSFAQLTQAMRSLGVPGPMVVQLMLLYRYFFLIAGEAGRMKRARDLRSPSSRVSLSVAASMIGSLLSRSMDRAHEVWMAMKLRGLDREIKTAHLLRWRTADSFFLAAVVLFCALFRFLPVTHWMGEIWLSI